MPTGSSSSVSCISRILGQVLCQSAQKVRKKETGKREFRHAEAQEGKEGKEKVGKYAAPTLIHARRTDGRTDADDGSESYSLDCYLHVKMPETKADK